VNVTRIRRKVAIQDHSELIATVYAKNYRRRQPQCRLTPLPQKPREYPHIPYGIFLDNTIIGLHFAADSMSLSSF